MLFSYCLSSREVVGIPTIDIQGIEYDAISYDVWINGTQQCPFKIIYIICNRVFHVVYKQAEQYKITKYGVASFQEAANWIEDTYHMYLLGKGIKL